MIVTEVQKKVLAGLAANQRQPRGSCERLKKKGLVKGDRRSGWELTEDGKRYVVSMTWGKC